MKEYQEITGKGSYVVKKYGTEYKVCQLLRGCVYDALDRPNCGKADEKSEAVPNDEKLACNLSRAKARIFELASCNEWQYFVTLTLSSEYDRENLPLFRKRFTQWVRDQRKRGSDIKYLLVPELHKNGAWHLHGFLSGVVDVAPFAADDIGNTDTDKTVKKWKADDLNRKGYLNWRPYCKKFGYCSLAPVKDPMRAARYATKYITKDQSSDVLGLGQHLFYASVGLDGAKVVQVGKSDDIIYPDDIRGTHYFENEYVRLWWVKDVEKLPIFAP